MGSYIPQGPT
ncbi:unnamed protein product, partial [Adineta steineri]